MAFTKSQRLAIKRRDNHKCQAPFRHKCQGRLEIHHVIPQRYSKTVLLLTEEEVDRPENALTICQAAHRIIHPDLDHALRNYREIKASGKQPFEELAKSREDVLSHKHIYWNDKFDRLMLTTAFQRTAKARRKQWVFPPHRHNGHKRNSRI